MFKNKLQSYLKKNSISQSLLLIIFLTQSLQAFLNYLNFDYFIDTEVSARDFLTSITVCLNKNNLDLNLTLLSFFQLKLTKINKWHVCYDCGIKEYYARRSRNFYCFTFYNHFDDNIFGQYLVRINKMFDRAMIIMIHHHTSKPLTNTTLTPRNFMLIFLK